MEYKVVETIKGVLTWLNETWPSFPLEDLPLGERQNNVECPIARALFIKTGKVYSVGMSAYIHKDDKGIIDEDGGLPPCAREFVHLFDRGEIQDLDNDLFSTKLQIKTEECK